MMSTETVDVSISMSLHLGDAMRETAHLSPAEMGAHIRLCMAAWSRGGCLPSDPERLRRMARVDAVDWPLIWGVLQDLWQESGDGRVSQPRTLAEIERAWAKKVWAILSYLDQVATAGESREIASLKASDLCTTTELEALPELLASAAA